MFGTSLFLLVGLLAAKGWPFTMELFFSLINKKKKKKNWHFLFLTEMGSS
jgi:hypothetical protein